MTDSSGDISTVRDWAIRQLSEGGVPDPSVDADLILGFVWGLTRGEVEAKALTGGVLPADTHGERAQFTEFVERRAAREPLQHILGVAWFRSLELEVGPGVFVPRPETELLAEFAVEALRAQASPSPIGVDLGTGSGAIAISMATEVPHATVYAVEKSPDALPWTRKNIARYGNRVTLVEGDLARALTELDGTVSVVASNPPYIPDSAIPRDVEVARFDPAIALFGGEDGLDVVRSLSLRARDLVHPGGVLIIEHGELQGAEIRALLQADGWRNPQTLRDLTQRDRYTRATRP